MRLTHAIPATRRFEFVQGNSDKFWEVRRDGSDVVIRFGRIGAAGQTAKKSFLDEFAAAHHVSRIIREKTGKGYVEVPA